LIFIIVISIFIILLYLFFYIILFIIFKLYNFIYYGSKEKKAWFFHKTNKKH
jgi:hypothetical protein